MKLFLKNVSKFASVNLIASSFCFAAENSISLKSGIMDSSVRGIEESKINNMAVLGFEVGRDLSSALALKASYITANSMEKDYDTNFNSINLNTRFYPTTSQFFNDIDLDRSQLTGKASILPVIGLGVGYGTYRREIPSSVYTLSAEFVAVQIHLGVEYSFASNYGVEAIYAVEQTKETESSFDFASTNQYATAALSKRF